MLFHAEGAIGYRYAHCRHAGGMLFVASKWGRYRFGTMRAAMTEVQWSLDGPPQRGGPARQAMELSARLCAPDWRTVYYGRVDP